MKKLDGYLEEAIKNIREDRAITATLLTDLVVYLRAAEERHREVGPVAAKYVETLQRSNEQLVKVVALIQKKANVKVNLTEEDKDEIFDILNKETE